MEVCYCKPSAGETEIHGYLGLVTSHSRLYSEFQNCSICCLRQSRKVRQYLRNDSSVFFNFHLHMHLCEWTYTWTHTHTYPYRPTHTPAHMCTNMHTYVCLHTCVHLNVHVHTRKICDTPDVLKFFTRHLKDTSYYTLHLLLCASKEVDDFSAQKPCLFSHPSATWKYWKDNGLARKEIQVSEIILFPQSLQYNSRMSWFYNHITQNKLNHIWSSKPNKIMLCFQVHTCAHIHICMHACAYVCRCMCTFIHMGH